MIQKWTPPALRLSPESKNLNGSVIAIIHGNHFLPTSAGASQQKTKGGEKNAQRQVRNDRGRRVGSKI